MSVSPRSFDMPLGTASVLTPPAANVVMPRPRIPIGNDALKVLQGKTPAPSGILTEAPGAATTPGIATTCQTNSANGFTPSDIIGAVGPTNIVVTTNVSVGVYNKSTCSTVSLVTLSAFFGGASGETLFDPQVLWDFQNSRFIVTVESEFSGNTNQKQYFAISQDSSGTSWWVYSFFIINGSSIFCVPSNAAFWDYQKVGSVNGSNPAWMITANVFPSGNPDGDGPAVPDTASLLSIQKTPTLTGASATVSCFGGLQFNLIPPNVTDSNSTAYLLSPGSGSGSSVQRYALNPNTTLTTTAAVSIPSWTAAPLVLQPNGQALDPLDGRFESHSIQTGNSIWNVHNISAGSVGLIRAYQFDASATTPVNSVTLTTTSAASPTDNLFNASIATNATQAFINVSRTIPSNPSIGNAAMLMLVGPSTLAGSWSGDVVATSAAQYNDSANCGADGYCRWGDYSSIQIDPSNSNNAWGFNQLITGSSEFNWTTMAALEGSSSPVGRVAHDFNNDGKSDIGLRDTSGNTVIWLMNGIAILNQNSSFVGNVPTQWTIVGQRDFNGDGNADLLWRDTSGNVAIWEMNGITVLNANSSFVSSVPTNWSVVGTGDFNGDGKGDILWRDTTGNVAIWEMNGIAILNPSSSFVGNVPGQWSVKGTGDFNGDGKADILWQDTSGNVAIWEMNGTTVLNPNSSSVGNVPAQWSIKGTGDFNGDGKADILWQDSAGNVAIWEMNGTAILNPSSSFVANVPSQWSIQLTGDYNGDGKSDILWEDTSRNLVAWEMNGTAILNPSNSFIATLPSQWSVQRLAAD